MKTVYQTLRFSLMALLFQLAALSLFSQAPVIVATQVVEDYPNSVDVTLQAFHFEDMVSMQFVLTFDPDQVEYDDFIDFNLAGLDPTAVNFVPPNSIHFSWIAPDLPSGETLMDGESICTIRFIPSVQGYCSFLFDLDSPVFPEFVNADFEVLDYLLLDCGVGGGVLSGNVYADQNANCSFEGGEPSLGGFQVQIVSEGTSTFVRTRDDGTFYYPILPDDDTLTVSVIPPTAYWTGCNVPEVVEISDPGGNIEIDLGMTALDDCKQLGVEIGAPFLRRCFTSRYIISYCNQGTLPVDDVEVVVDFDPFLEVDNSTIPWSTVDGNAYTFPIGDLDIGECGSFDVWLTVSCDAELGQTHCTEATIYPIEFCNPAPGWDGAQLSISGSCNGDEVEFEIENIGQETMSDASGYIVIEDDMIKMMESIDPLQPEESIALQFPASGSTWRVEVAQVPDFPVPSAPSATVEACDSDGDGIFSLGFVNMYSQDEYASYVSKDCQENIGSWDPNDKAAFPVGYGDEHIVEPNTRLEYRIRFQNTGSDTAFNVVIRDTLSGWVQPNTVNLQATSHLCDLEVKEDGELVVRFPNILLPDSTTNEPASHGFIQFSVEQFPDNPLGEVIENRAAIYFDYNDPVITNEVFHTIGVDFVEDVSSAHEVPVGIRYLQVSPNPAEGPVQVQLPGVSSGNLKLHDLTGRTIRDLPFQNGVAIIERKNIPAGLYWVVLEARGKVVGVGQVVFDH